MQKYGLGNMAMAELCDRQETSFYTVVEEVHAKIKKHYDCRANRYKNRCTQFEIGAMQFFNSTITRNPIPSIVYYPSSYTSKKWGEDLTQFQYKNYLGVLGDPEIDQQVFTYEQMVSLLSFDKLYSVGGVMDMLLETNITKFEEVYYWKHKQYI